MNNDPESERGLFWFDHLTDRFGDPLDGGVLGGVHPATLCAGQACALHAPSDHPLVRAPLNWRQDRQMLERLCEHGVGHPDPDSLAYRRRIGIDDTGTHGCCGCCLG